MYEKLTTRIGAKILGPWNAPEVRSHLPGLLAEHGLLYLPGADLSAAEQLELAGVFGTPITDRHPLFGHAEDVPEVSVIINDRDNPPAINVWHSDLTYLQVPAGSCVLQCIEAPPKGGDTLWSSMTAAYEGLSEPMKHFISQLRAEHRLSLDSVPVSRAKQVINDPIVASHPVVRVIPETGERALFINRHYVHHIEGLSRVESRGVLAALCDLAESPDFQVRISWQAGDIVVWDNRQTQHFAVADYYPDQRKMHRIALVGEKPVGVSQAV